MKPPRRLPSRHHLDVADDEPTTWTQLAHGLALMPKRFGSSWSGSRAETRKNPCGNCLGHVPDNYKMRHKVALILKGSPLGNNWDILQTLLSVVACMFYVADTYGIVIDSLFDLIFTFLFTIDYLVRLYAASNRWLHPLRFNSLVDFFTIVPVYMEQFAGESAGQFSFLRFVRVLRVMRILRAFKILNQNLTAVTRQLFTLVLTVSSIVFLSAGLVHVVETVNPLTSLQDSLGADYIATINCDDPTHSDDSPEAEYCSYITFGDALYFIVVTISTVGYGDISPSTVAGRIIVSLMIIVSLVMIPMQVNELSALLAMQSRYRKTYEVSPTQKHALVVGHIKNPDQLRSFLIEFFHVDRMGHLDVDAQKRQLVIVSPEDPSEDVATVLVNPMFENQVRFIKASVMSEADLYRVAADAAEACFVVSDTAAIDNEEEDKRTLLRTLVIKNFNPSLPVYVHMLSTENESLVWNAGVESVVCVDRLKLQLMTRSVDVVGVSTMVVNLLRSLSSEGLDNNERWLSEYIRGADREVYTVPCPAHLEDWSFLDAAFEIYRNFHGNVIVWGVEHNRAARGRPETPKASKETEEDSDDGDPAFEEVYHEVKSDRSTRATAVLLNPGSDYRLRRGQNLFVTASDRDLALAINLASNFPRSTVSRKPLWATNPLVGTKSTGPLNEASLYGFQSAGRRVQQTQAKSGHQMVVEAEAEARGEMARKDFDVREELESLMVPEVSSELLGHRQHVLLTGDMESMGSFLTLLRVTNQTVPVVLLHTMEDDAIDAASAALLGHQKRVYGNLWVVKGNALVVRDLYRAGLTLAATVVVLDSRDADNVIDSTVLDSEVIFTYLSIEQAVASLPCHRMMYVLADCSSATNLSVLNSKRVNRDLLKGFDARRSLELTAEQVASRNKTIKREAKAQRDRRNALTYAGASDGLTLPIFAAGYSFPVDSFHTLLIQAFYDGKVYDFAQALLTPGDHSGRLEQTSLPDYLHGKSFKEVFFARMIDAGEVVVGIYRSAGGSNDAPLNYVYTAPDADDRVYAEDLLFVLHPLTFTIGDGIADDGSEGGDGPIWGAGSSMGAATKQAPVVAELEMPLARGEAGGDVEEKVGGSGGTPSDSAAAET